MKFEKEILPVGKYSVPTQSGRMERKFSTKILREIATTANKMISTGLRIPAPFEHHKEAIPVTEAAAPAHSYLNGGYWTKFWIANKHGKPALFGEVEAPGDISDWNTPAGKIATTSNQTSVCIADQFLDGLDRTWKNAMLHVALVSQPVVPAQTDFAQLSMAHPPQSHIINLSMSTSPDDSRASNPGFSSVDISGLRGRLKDIVKLFLPDSTTPETLLRDLDIAVSQFELSRPAEGDGQLQPVPIYMSSAQHSHSYTENDMSLSAEQISALIATGAVNPATKKPFTADDFVSQPKSDPRLEAAMSLAKALGESHKKTVIDGLNRRIQALINQGLPKEVVETILAPKVNTFQMSIENGAIAEHPLESTLQVLESVMATKAIQTGTPVPTAPFQFSTSVPLGSQIQMAPQTSGELSDAESEALANQMLSYIN